MRIDHRPIGPGHPCFIVAEIAGSHAGELANVPKLIHAAKAAGADAVKILTARPEDLTLQRDDPRFRIASGVWAGKTLWEIYEAICMPLEWHETVKAEAIRAGLVWFSSPQSAVMVDFLEELRCPAYKIASPELDYTRLVRHCLATGKPTILSTGAWPIGDIERVMGHHTRYIGQIGLLHCVAAYPTRVRDANLPRMRKLESLFGMATVFQARIGISDHSLHPMLVPVLAVAQGAHIVEKHLRLPGVPCLDDGHALTPDQFRLMVAYVRSAESALQARNHLAEADASQWQRHWVGDSYVRCGPEKVRYDATA